MLNSQQDGRNKTTMANSERLIRIVVTLNEINENRVRHYMLMDRTKHLIFDPDPNANIILEEDIVLLKQTASGLNKVIQESGCNMRCLQAIAEILVGKALTTTQINTLFNRGVAGNYISSNCFVNDGNEVIKASFTLFEEQAASKEEEARIKAIARPRLFTDREHSDGDFKGSGNLVTNGYKQGAIRHRFIRHQHDTIKVVNDANGNEIERSYGTHFVLQDLGEAEISLGRNKSFIFDPDPKVTASDGGWDGVTKYSNTNIAPYIDNEKVECKTEEGKTETHFKNNKIIGGFYTKRRYFD